MDNRKNGINEDALGELSINILDFSDRISEIFEKIDNQMNSLSTCYQGESYDNLMNYYNNFRKNYQIIKENIVSYSDDLTTLLHHQKENDAYFASIISNFTTETNAKTKGTERL